MISTLPTPSLHCVRSLSSFCRVWQISARGYMLQITTTDFIKSCILQLQHSADPSLHSILNIAWPFLVSSDSPAVCLMCLGPVGADRNLKEERSGTKSKMWGHLFKSTLIWQVFFPRLQNPFFSDVLVTQQLWISSDIKNHQVLITCKVLHSVV